MQKGNSDSWSQLFHSWQRYRKQWSSSVAGKGSECEAKDTKTQLLSESSSLDFCISRLTVRLGTSKMCACMWGRSCAHASLAIIELSGRTRSLRMPEDLWKSWRFSAKKKGREKHLSDINKRGPHKRLTDPFASSSSTSSYRSIGFCLKNKTKQKNTAGTVEFILPRKDGVTHSTHAKGLTASHDWDWDS